MTEPLDLEPIKARLADGYGELVAQRDVLALIAEVERLRGIELLGVPEAAKAAGVSQHLIRRKAKEGELPFHVVVGGRRAFRREDVAAFVADRRRRAESDGRIRVPFE